MYFCVTFRHLLALTPFLGYATADETTSTRGGRRAMAALLTFLTINTSLIQRAARVLEQASKEQPFQQPLSKLDYIHSEPLFFHTYLALREVEVRGLRLLHEVAVLSQMLQHEQRARDYEKELEKQLKAQER